jgi:hypothetical protein
MSTVDSLIGALADAIQESGLPQDVLGSEYLAGGRFVRAFDRVLARAFRSLGLQVLREAPNPWVRAWQRANPAYRLGSQRMDYLLRRAGRPVGVAELESLDRPQMMTFQCQYHDWDNGKRDYYFATVAQLVADPGLPRPEFFLFVLALPDFRVRPYTIWDTSDDYYGVSRSDRPAIYRSPYRFYDHRIKALLRAMLLNRDPEATPDDDWLVGGKRLADLQDVCELAVVTVTGPELVLSRGRDLFRRSREQRRLVRWTGRARPAP